MSVRDARQNEEMPPEVSEYGKKLVEYRRSVELKDILNTVGKISNGGTDMTLTCGIGVIQKKTARGIVNYPLLEIDLRCRKTESGDWSFAPECLPDSNHPDIRPCPSLDELEESKDTEDHTLQKGAQKKLNRFAKSQRSLDKLEMLKEEENRDDSVKEEIQRLEERVKKLKPGPAVNPFKPSTYVSLLRDLGKLNPQFKDVRTPSAQEADELLSDASAKDQLQIFDMWIIFQSGGKDAKKGVFRDAKRFVQTLNSTVSIPPLWKPIALNIPVDSSHGASDAKKEAAAIGAVVAPAAATKLESKDAKKEAAAIDVVTAPVTELKSTEPEPASSGTHADSLSSFQEHDFLLPLKQSAEQLDILMSLKSNDCVIVKGPPGTGKSHTIGE